MSLSSHAAPGPAAGALFQPIRALWWLAQCPPKGAVSIELFDDVACVCEGKLIALEQDKNSITPDSPLTNRSIDLWKTFAIWLGAVRDGEVDAEARFHLVTNRKIKGGWLRKLMEAGAGKDEFELLAAELRKIGRDASSSIKQYVNETLAHSDLAIADLLRRIAVEDAGSGSAGEELKQKTLARLHIPTDCPGDEIYNSLLGWIVNAITLLLNNGENAVIERDAFSRAFVNALDVYYERSFRERAARLLTVTQQEREAERDRLFVKQLLLLKLAEADDYVIDAIDEIIQRRKELTRFAKEGSITDIEIAGFEDRVLEKWKGVFRRHVRAFESTDRQNPERAGLDILDECREHRETLAGRMTQEYYLTRGTFHDIANRRDGAGMPNLGWHPDFKKLLASAT